MSGGIRYRLSPEERQLLMPFIADADTSEGILAPLKKAAKSQGMDIPLEDPELNVEVEEEKGEIKFTFTYPVDSDASARNGRIYLTDEFVLSAKNLYLLKYQRSLKPNNPNILFTKLWESRMNALLAVPVPSPTDNDVRRFSKEVLAKLHRPFPVNFPAILAKHVEIFNAVDPILRKHKVSVNLLDPQSGMRLSLEDEKLGLQMVLVLDTESQESFWAEKNGRLFLSLDFPVDPVTHALKEPRRNVLAQEPLNSALKQAREEIQGLPQPIHDSIHQAFAQAMLKDMGIGKKTVEAPPEIAASKPPMGDWSEPSRRILQNLWELTDVTPRFESQVVLSLSKGKPSGAVGGLFKDDLSRRALHDTVDLLLKKDPQTAERVGRWLEEQHVSPPFVPLLKALASLSEGKLDEARGWVRRADTSSALQRRVENLIQRQIHKSNAEAALKILKNYVWEKNLKLASQDRALVKAAWRGLTGDEGVNWSARGEKAAGIIAQLETFIQKEETTLETALKKLPLTDPLEIALREAWLKDRGIVELLSLSKNSDPRTRAHDLVQFSEQRLLKEEGLQTTALNAMDWIPATTPGADRLERWLSGRATFGQKIDMLGPRMAEEVISLPTIASMILAGGAASLGKFAFMARFGAETRALRLGSEGAALLLEAPAFMISDKTIRSFIDTPDRQWDHPFKELGGLYLSFGVLRGMGVATQGLNRYWGNLNALKKYGEGTLRWKPAQHLEPIAERLPMFGRPSAEFFGTLGGKGLSRAWVLPTVQGMTTHVLGPSGLILANSLARSLNLRPGSPQGFGSDVAEDLLMYGHFMLSGSLAQRMSLRPLDPYNHWMEAQGREQQMLGKTTPVAEVKAETETTALAATEPVPAAESAPSRRGPLERFRKFSELFRRRSPASEAEGPREARTWRTLFEKLPESLRRHLEKIPWFRNKAAEAPQPAVEANSPTLKTEAAEPAETGPDSAPRSPAAKPEQAETPETAREISETEVAANPWSDKTPPSAQLPVSPPRATPPAEIAAPEPSPPPRENPEPALKPDALPSLPPVSAKETRPLVFTPVFEPPVPEKIQPMAFILSKKGKSAADAWFLGTRSLPETNEPAEFLFSENIASLTTPLAKLSRMKSGLPEGEHAGWQFFLENLKAEAPSQINGRPAEKGQALADGDSIAFDAQGPTFMFRKNAKTGEAALIQTDIQIGRIHRTEKLPDVLFPSSERNVSRRHARLHYDAKNNRYLLTDTSEMGTGYERSGQGFTAIYRNTSAPMKNGDEIFLGSQNPSLANETSILSLHLPELKFDGWPALEAGKTIPVPAPLPPPPAEVHPVFRHSTPLERSNYLLELLAKLRDGYIIREEEGMTSFHQVRLDLATHVARVETHAKPAAEIDLQGIKDLANDVSHYLNLDKGQQIALLPSHASWRLGEKPQGDAHTLAIPLGPRAKGEASLYLDANGHLILRAEAGGEGVYLQVFDASARGPSLLPIKTWTVLQGGERIFLGKKGLYFDIELGALLLPSKPLSSWSMSGDGLLKLETDGKRSP